MDLPQIVGFEWDGVNEEKNRTRHTVSRSEAEDVFFHQPALVYPDPRHARAGDRFYLLGRTVGDRRLFVVCTVRRNRIRVISARDMSQKERRIYDEALKEDS